MMADAGGHQCLLMLVEPEDTLALRVFAELSSEIDVQIVTSAEISVSNRFVHRVGSEATRTQLSLFDGLDIEVSNIGVVWNRMSSVHVPQFASSASADREYAAAEFYALWLSWIAGCSCRVVGRPTARGLSFPSLGRIEWLARARALGLKAVGLHISTNARWFGTRGWQASLATGESLSPSLLGRNAAVFEEGDQNDQCSVVVVGPTVVGSPCASVDRALLELSRANNCPLLEATFVRAEVSEPWRLASISEVRTERAEVVSAVANYLLNQTEAA